MLRGRATQGSGRQLPPCDSPTPAASAGLRADHPPSLSVAPPGNLPIVWTSPLNARHSHSLLRAIDNRIHQRSSAFPPSSPVWAEGPPSSRHQRRSQAVAPGSPAFQTRSVPRQTLQAVGWTGPSPTLPRGFRTAFSPATPRAPGWGPRGRWHTSPITSLSCVRPPEGPHGPPDNVTFLHQDTRTGVLAHLSSHIFLNAGFTSSSQSWL